MFFWYSRSNEKSWVPDGLFHPRYFEKGPLEPERHTCLQILFFLLKQTNLLFEEPMRFFLAHFRIPIPDINVSTAIIEG